MYMQWISFSGSGGAGGPGLPDYTSLLREMCVTSKMKGFLCACTPFFHFLWSYGDINDQLRREGWQFYPYQEIKSADLAIPRCEKCDTPKFTLGPPEKGAPHTKS